MVVGTDTQNGKKEIIKNQITGEDDRETHVTIPMKKNHTEIIQKYTEIIQKMYAIRILYRKHTKKHIENVLKFAMTH